jgi:hypothetical protein
MNLQQRESRRAARALRRIVRGLLAGVLLAGCGSSSSGDVGGESHFACSSDVDCEEHGEDLVCAPRRVCVKSSAIGVPVAPPPDAGADARGNASSACEGVDADPMIDLERSPPERAVHREVALNCEETRPCNYVYDNPSPGRVCDSHSDCSDGENGRCQPFGYECSYDACFRDADCALNEICDCAGGPRGSHRCLVTECLTDSDCPGAAWCSPSRAVECTNLSDVVGYYCHSGGDECVTDGDCGLGWCVFDDTLTHFRCSDSACTAGP